MENVIRKKVDYLTKEEYESVQKAIQFAKNAHEGQFRATGEPYVTHPMQVCNILADYGADCSSLIAALLHDVVEDTSIPLKELQGVFGEEVASLVDGLTKTAKGSVEEDEYKASNFKKLLLAAEQDIRVAIIKLADRLHNMRTLSVKKVEKRISYANETVVFFTPLAEKLGLKKMQAELEELAFEQLQPTMYEKMCTFIHNYTNLFNRAIEQCRLCLQNNSTCSIQMIVWDKEPIYRAYSLLQEEYMLSDLFHIKIVTDSPLACYSTLGVLHQLFQPITSSFEDNLAIQRTPFSRHIKTKVMICDMEITVIIQAEKDYLFEEAGVWNFLQEAKGKEQVRNVSTALLKDSIYSAGVISTSAVEFYDFVSLELFQREMNVFTKQLDVVSLPEGATVLDFAFAFDPSVATHIGGAKVNGIYKSIGELLHNMDVVELIVENQEQVRWEWLHHVYTSKAMHTLSEILEMTEEDVS
ncbi:HD domain-containing protein [Priestia taiwanensis]|uniref:HD domain-containing protein n=1 Tax=Priestia taiwanensis TaxID=1347902 RepID=A0A917AJU5_9BACI|nr:HD domain-containing protein [Priestia taiwanensis]MBM7361726.1 GTP pyrophosphokinase [Priestia taiwanensis]GGE56472.1 hypothetical protein GCM10007140_03510 [Priestia taiwanensis]